jgi:hypothetical protein
MLYTIDEINQVVIKSNVDGSVSYIPMNETNLDYQRYLNPEAEQFTPIVAAE